MLSLVALAAVQTVMAASPVIEHASQDDCAIIVAIGRSQVNWGRKGPSQPFYVDVVQPDGKIYRQDCPWRKYGVGAPTPASPGAPAFAIGRPVYGPDRRTATAAMVFLAFHGNELPPLDSSRTCSLDKPSGRWRVIRCAGSR